MKVRPIVKHHLTNCVYCKANGQRVQAVWHLTGANKQACDAHKFELYSFKRIHEELNRLDHSEADHQTWLKL